MSKKNRYGNNVNPNNHPYSGLINPHLFNGGQPMFDFKNENRARYERRKGGKKSYRHEVSY